MDLQEYVKDQFDQVHERLSRIESKVDAQGDDLVKHKTLWGIAGAIILVLIGEIVSHAFGG